MAQSVCHLRLATLKKYSLPREGLFKHIVCPHYTMECIIYLVLALAAAPRGQTLNRTMAASLFFVATNLGVTARGTQAWYAEKFGADKVPRWKMIPLIF
jgi:3-oxo-5-alpha-steroid 4-dehydrogenase 3